VVEVPDTVELVWGFPPAPEPLDAVAVVAGWPVDALEDVFVEDVKLPPSPTEPPAALW
jgi:hypothetical protein